MNPEQFFNKVAEMREAQKTYFAIRDPSTLRKSKALETEIDREIKRVRQIKAAEHVKAISPSLFGDDNHDSKTYEQ